MKKTLFLSTLFTLLVLFLGCLSSCKNPEKSYQVFESIAFDTTVTVKIRPQDDLDYTALFEKISSEILTIEKAASLYLSDSELSQLNQKGTLQASDEFIKILQIAIHAGDQTQGSFDISIQPLWDFYQGSTDFTSIEDALLLVNYQNITIHDGLVRLKPNMKLSFNGFIQGYVTDSVFQILTEAGVKSALINGGEYRALGQDYNSPWQVTITGDSGQELATLDLKDSEAIAVTAGYGYVFTESPTKSSHIFDPRNRKKINKKSTYVVHANNATNADIYATAAAIVDQSKWDTIKPPTAHLSVFE